MPLIEDVGFIITGVSWSDLDVTNNMGDKQVDGEHNLPLLYQANIVKGVSTGDKELVTANLIEWQRNRAHYELAGHPTSKWFTKVSITRDYWY